MPTTPPANPDIQSLYIPQGWYVRWGPTTPANYPETQLVLCWVLLQTDLTSIQPMVVDPDDSKSIVVAGELTQDYTLDHPYQFAQTTTGQSQAHTVQ